MSVEELRARIVTLDSEIERQRSEKNPLEKLEKDKIFALRQLNAALDPVARLPVEISSEIFLCSLAAIPGKQDVPTGLLRVCSFWTDIALATPALWTSVRIRFPCGDDVAEVLPIWFRRARSRPISMSISLCGSSSNWNRHVSDVLWRHGGQFKHLEIFDDDGFVPDDESCTIDLFGDTTSVCLLSLQTLAIHCQHQRRGYFESQIFALLRGAPNIVEVIFDNMRAVDDPDARVLVVPTLRRLTFGGPTTDTDDFIFHYLALPSLETLFLPLCYISGDELVACVQRSASPLRDLTLGCQFRTIGLSHMHLHKCLSLTSSLVRFTMWLPHSDVATELFTALANSASLLPNLHDLTIHILDTARSPPDISDVSWRSLVRALSTRRMEQVHIVPIAVSPPMDVLTSLRELVAHGATIYIGTEDLNVVVA
ncbi:hypothetical protein C8R45DRAFT_1101876 [Mycena sanguinolenta]|nr:hypothetical protein C8R45DRAFT_1101876 [Mycena sanguinolenta]